jgi:hypothetical protein
VGAAVPLRANAGLCYQGMNLVGRGFVLEAEELPRFGVAPDRLNEVVRPYANARDITQGGAPRWVIDFYGWSVDDARDRHPALYQRLLETVKPERDQNKDKQRKRDWWLFGRSNSALRAALAGLPRFIVTPKTAKHRIFLFADEGFVPDSKLFAFALADGAALGVLSSRAAVLFATQAGAWLGVGNDSTYNNGDCFDPFPFPDLDAQPALRARIAALAERLDAHRKAVQSTVPKAHLTAQYNALARAREARAGGPPLSAAEAAFHAAALTGVLQSLHDDLDAAVAQAYGWPADLPDDALLERLVALNRARAEEEARGLVRHLRPALQAPAQPAPFAPPPADAPADAEAGPVAPAGPAAAPLPWPPDTRGRLLALRDALRAADAPRSPDELAPAFAGARPKDLRAALDALADLGVLSALPDGRYAST